MNLKLGMKGPEITIWQNFLISRGILLSPFGADGEFGPATVEGTKLWQSRANISPTGQVDKATTEMASKFGTGSGLVTLITSKPDTDPVQSAINTFSGTGLTHVQRINEVRLAKIAPLVAQRVRQFIEVAENDGIILQIVQGLRTWKEQDALYAQGRSKKGPVVTNARGGQSLHNYGLAVDLAPIVDGKVSWDEKLFKAFNKWDDVSGLDWGGNWKKFKDLPHVQDTEGMNLAQVQRLYREGGLSLVWDKVK